jgi:hypothetical protein
MPVLTRPAQARKGSAPRFTPRLNPLEDRLTPALTFQFDYSLDASGFFADPSHRQVLEQAAADLSSRIDSTPAAITPGGTDTWTALFNNPGTGAQSSVSNLTIPAGAVRVYAGGGTLGGGEAGEGGPGGYSVTGSPAFMQSVMARGGGGTGLWGGSVSFDTTQNWYFGGSAAGLPAGAVDFYSVATHELGHVLGIGTAKQWGALVRGGAFTGATAEAVYGAAPPVSPDGSHWAQGIKSDGEPVSVQPMVEANRRVNFSQLDYAALQDLGWQVSGLPGSPAPVASTLVPTPTTDTDIQAGAIATPVSPAPPPVAPPVGGVPAGRLVVLSGAADGSIQPYILSATGQLAPVGAALHPFSNFGGAVRTVTADVNGDGVADIVAATGPGGGSRLKVIDGRTFTDMVPEQSVFESSFAGGVFLAAGDFRHDGRDDIVVTPDQGGGPRVKVLEFVGGQTLTVADFFGINDPNFRGGARPAVGDINADGTPDLVVAAGFGGGPRVSVIDGTTVASGAPKRTLSADFFAFEPGLRNGAYVTVGDVDGDGFGDLIFGAGPGGGPRVLAVSGKSLVTAGPAAALAAPLANLFAGDPSQRGGVRVAAHDLNGDGKADVVTGGGQGGTVQVFQPRPGGLTATQTFAPFGDTFDGVYVG